jgi:cell division protein FtsB
MDENEENKPNENVGQANHVDSYEFNPVNQNQPEPLDKEVNDMIAAPTEEAERLIDAPESPELLTSVDETARQSNLVTFDINKHPEVSKHSYDMLPDDNDVSNGASTNGAISFTEKTTPTMPSSEFREADSISNQPPKSNEKLPKPKSSKPRVLRNVLIICLVALLMVVSSGATYWYRDKVANDLEKQQTSQIASLRSSITSLSEQISDLKASAANSDSSSTGGDSSNTCTVASVDAADVSNIEKSITSGKVSDLTTYMANEVSVIMVGLSATTNTNTSTQAITAIKNFISDDSDSWDYDFNLPTSKTDIYAQSSYNKYFPSTAIIGLASNNQLISLSFNCASKIDAVFLATDANSVK